MESNVVSVLVEPGRVELEERPLPEPDRLEVVVEVASVGVCGSDIHYFEHGRIGDFVVQQPLVLGHESSGRIVAVGTDVSGLRPGQRVAIEPGVPDGRCKQCRRGHYNLCPDMRFLATPPIDGAFARFISVHADFAHPVPDSVGDDEAALLEPLSVGVWANRRSQVSPDDTVLVTGAGPIGVLCAQVARASGAAVLITDVEPSRIRIASELLGLPVLDGREILLSELEPAPTVLLECTGSAAVVADAVRALAPGGRAVLVGMGAESDIPLPVAFIQAREIEVTGSFRYANAYPAALGLVERGEIELSGLAMAHFGLADVAEALTTPGRDPSVLKAIVHPNH